MTYISNMNVRKKERRDKLKAKLFKGEGIKTILKSILYVVSIRNFIRISMIMANDIMFVSPIIFLHFFMFKSLATSWTTIKVLPFKVLD